MSVVVEPALHRVVHSQARCMIRSMCGDTFDDRFLLQVERWSCAELVPWLDELLLPATRTSSNKWQHVLSRHVLEEFGSLRISQLFDMIKEFPDR
jgi:anaphase-promoting complex subunit 2